MTTGEKLSRLRRENNYTQEQLAERLGVSRQSISKWESDAAYPETERIIELSRLFGCTADYLLKDEAEEVQGLEQAQEMSDMDGFIRIPLHLRERKSEKIVFGMPLWCVGKSAKGFIAVGLYARGVISVGLLSAGVFSVGLCSVGVLAFGLFAAGLIASGCFSVGALTFGAITLGLLSFGGVAAGTFAVGGAAAAKYGALGDCAYGMFAFGDSKASGSVIEHLGKLSPEEREAAAAVIKDSVPAFLRFFADIFCRLL